MLYGNDRSALRKIYFDAWHKYKNNLPLEGLEKQLSTIISQHPKYHAIFDNPEKYLEYDFAIDHDGVNPFLHLALHTTILEQVSIDAPKGVTAVYQQLMNKYGDSLEVEHQMINILVDEIQHVHNTGNSFNVENYLAGLQNLITR